MGVKSRVPGCWLGETLWISARDGMTQVVQRFPSRTARGAALRWPARLRMRRAYSSLIICGTNTGASSIGVKSLKISTILDKVDENQLFVPAFQREYVWKRDDAKMLVDSLIKEYPTGTMLTWETASPPELKGPHKYDPRQGAVRILLDGQQRITTLYMLIRDKIPPYYIEPEIKVDPRGLFVNVETLELAYFSRARMENNPLWQNITGLFQKKIRDRDVVTGLEARGETVSLERYGLIDDNVGKIESILDRDFPEQTVPIRASVRQAIDIFYKVNASGVALTDAELALAQISGYWPEARDIFKKKMAALAAHGFVLRLDFFVYALLGCLYNAGSEMQKLHGEENNEAIRAAWDKLDNRILDYVMNVLRTSAFVDHTSEINSTYALIPIIVYCYERNASLSDLEIRKMVKWFYYSQIRTRYVGQLQQKLDRDLRVLKESKEPFDELLRVITEEQGPLKILPTEFAGRAIQHPLFSMMRWYLKSKGAVCFTTGLGIRHNVGSSYQLENDHIFPYSQLKAAGFGEGNRVKYALAQELTNRAILTQLANRTKSDTSASDYLTSVREKSPKALALQCIPEDPDLWQLENYEQFLEARRRMLADGLNQFFEGITFTDEQAGETVSLEEMILEGENDGLELKSSLRWDFAQGTVNKKLEDVVCKSVAAFANAGGGTLLIGIDDSGDAIGLENDYASLEADRDGFQLHLRNILNQQLGAAFVSRKASVSFPNVNGVEICRIDISPASEPIVIKVKGDKGQVTEKFYVRNGNASLEMPMSQLSSYLRERFE